MEIITNGSKWGNESPDSLDTLISILNEGEILNPTFEKYGRFFKKLPNGSFEAWGNFLFLSHVFQIRGTLEELRPLAIALKQSRKNPYYLIAKERCIRGGYLSFYMADLEQHSPAMMVKP